MEALEVVLIIIHQQTVIAGLADHVHVALVVLNHAHGLENQLFGDLGVLLGAGTLDNALEQAVLIQNQDAVAVRIGNDDLQRLVAVLILGRADVDTLSLVVAQGVGQLHTLQIVVTGRLVVLVHHLRITLLSADHGAQAGFPAVQALIEVTVAHQLVADGLPVLHLLQRHGVHVVTAHLGRLGCELEADVGGITGIEGQSVSSPGIIHVKLVVEVVDAIDGCLQRIRHHGTAHVVGEDTLLTTPQAQAEHVVAGAQVAVTASEEAQLVLGVGLQLDGALSGHTVLLADQRDGTDDALQLQRIRVNHENTAIAAVQHIQLLHIRRQGSMRQA